MSDPFSTMLDWQKQMLDAQRASLSAMHKGLNVGDGFVALQDAGHKAFQANLTAWNAWSKVWGGR